MELRPPEECGESKGTLEKSIMHSAFLNHMGKTTDKVNQRVKTQEGRRAAQHRLLGFFKRCE